MQAGTSGFQAPEQLRGEAISITCDVYALGGVLTELFGMQPIWEAKHTNHTIIYKVATMGEVPKYDHLPQSIQDVVKVCFCQADCRASAATVLAMLCDL